MISATETPFGPNGRVTLTIRVDPVVRFDKVGGPRMAVRMRREKSM